MKYPRSRALLALVIAASLITTVSIGGIASAKRLTKKKTTTQQKGKSPVNKSDPSLTIEAPPSNEHPTGKKTSKKNATREKVVNTVMPQVVDYLDRKVPADLVNLYKGTTLVETSNDVTKSLNKIITEGNITNTAVEDALRDTFSMALTDTNAFAGGFFTKYNLQNIATVALKNPKDIDAIKKAAQEEIKAYAEQEINKLANQALAAVFPVFQGVQIDFTNLNRKTLKATLRSAIINALAQSYLGPQYAAVYLAVSVVCPTCMVKTQAELRRFDKNYIQPLTDKAEAEWGRFEDRVKAESERVKKQIAAEYDRLKKRLSAELDRQRKDIQDEANRAKERFNAEFERAKNSKVGKEVERQLNDIATESQRTFDRANAEFNRETDDIINEAQRTSKRMAKELAREARQAEQTVKKASTAARDELKRENKRITNEAQRLKDKVQAELKRAASKAKKELKRAKKRLRL